MRLPFDRTLFAGLDDRRDDSPRRRFWLKVGLDVALAATLVFTIADVQLILAFHGAFQVLVIMAFVHPWRATAVRAAIGFGAIVFGVGNGVNHGHVGQDELYELPILMVTLLLVMIAVELVRQTLRQLRVEQTTINELHEAAQTELEEQLLVTQRLETMGVVGAGTVHDIRNGMTAVMSLAERIAETPPGEDHEHLAGRISAQARDAANGLGALLRLVRPEGGSEVSDIASLLDEEASTLELLDRPGVRITVHNEVRDLRVAMSPDRVRQILVNLVLNAVDAIDGSGTVHVRASRRAGDILLEVIDDGRGMDAETRTSATEAFFTTKPAGSGLGLYTVSLIASAAGGDVEITSAPNRGTTIGVTLPADAASSSASSAASPSMPAEAGTVDPAQLRGRRILVVDDDEDVRRWVGDQLSGVGCEVALAVDGAAAERMLRADPFHVVVSDVVMPGLTGTELYDSVRTQGMDIPFVFMSGLGPAQLPVLPPGEGFLPKPVDAAALVVAVGSRAG